MILVLASWSTQYFLLMGWGLLIRQIAGIGDLGDDDWFWTPWAGLFGILAFCMLWHFFAPINGLAAALAALIALLGCLLNRKKLAQNCRAFWGDRNFGFWILLCCVGLLCLKHATEAPKLFDSGAYHLAVVRWAQEYKILLGLGNVNGHYAFNNLHHLYLALIDGIFGIGRASHFVASFLWFWLFCKLVQGLFAAFQAPARITASLFSTFLLPLMIAWEASIMEPASDLPSGLAVLSVGLLTWEKLVWSEVPAIRSNAVRLLGLLCVVATTIKLSSLAVSIIFVIFGAYALYRDLSRRSLSLSMGDCVSPLLAASAFLLWMIRSSLLSGYPLFPIAVLPLPVEWRIPHEYASWFPYWIQTFARVPFRADDLGDNWWWTVHWINGSFRSEKYLAVLPCVLLVATWLIIAVRFRKVFPSSFRLEATFWVLGLFLALGAWFLGAPAIRFGAALIWLLLAASLALVMGAYWEAWGRNATFALFGLLVAFGFVDRILPLIRQQSSAGVHAVWRAVWLPPGPDMGLYPIPTPSLSPRTLPTGVRFYEPTEQSCPDENWQPCLAWSPPLPSAVPRLDDLAYLQPHLGAAGGFRLLIPQKGWVAHYAPMVKEIQAKTNASVRVLALRFRVHPNLIRQALETPVIATP